MKYSNDGQEIILNAGHDTGVVIRYGGKTRGLIVMLWGWEISYANYEALHSIKWNKVLRLVNRKGNTIKRWAR